MRRYIDILFMNCFDSEVNIVPLHGSQGMIVQVPFGSLADQSQCSV